MRGEDAVEQESNNRSADQRREAHHAKYPCGGRRREAAVGQQRDDVCVGAVDGGPGQQEDSAMVPKRALRAASRAVTPERRTSVALAFPLPSRASGSRIMSATAGKATANVRAPRP